MMTVQISGEAFSAPNTRYHTESVNGRRMLDKLSHTQLEEVVDLFRHSNQEMSFRMDAALRVGIENSMLDKLCCRVNYRDAKVKLYLEGFSKNINATFNEIGEIENLRVGEGNSNSRTYDPPLK